MYGRKRFRKDIDPDPRRSAPNAVRGKVFVLRPLTEPKNLMAGAFVPAFFITLNGIYGRIDVAVHFQKFEFYTIFPFAVKTAAKFGEL